MHTWNPENKHDLILFSFIEYLDIYLIRNREKKTCPRVYFLGNHSAVDLESIFQKFDSFGDVEFFKTCKVEYFLSHLEITKEFKNKILH